MTIPLFNLTNSHHESRPNPKLTTTYDLYLSVYLIVFHLLICTNIRELL